MILYKLLTSEQRRRLIDCQQTFEGWRSAETDQRRRFAGGMRWVTRGDARYLLRKIGLSETSLGPDSPETRRAYEAFVEGRVLAKERANALKQRLRADAPVNRAMRLGRIPEHAAKVTRKLDSAGLLGETVFVVGTNALYAYEAAAGVAFRSSALATGDLDLMYDARVKLSLASRTRLPAAGLFGLLKSVDRSYELLQKRGYRAVNKDGYFVDLVVPQPKRIAAATKVTIAHDGDDDLRGAEVFGLDWLINAPKIRTTAIDMSGLPAPIAAVDPRVFAIHKFWLADRKDRSPVKAPRDREQARAVATLAVRELGLSFESPDLSALPTEMRRALPDDAILAAEEDDAW